jgi:L-cysteine:1D-myo-inositol 2-amino-2-deoxy-alpha-D-glucopyranoside ligase
MTHVPVPSSGVLGAAGRVGEPGPLRSADLRLAGGPLPILGTARIYTCGITPYDVTHLGHAATFVWADALRGVLATAGVEVTIARNVTDVDDVLTRAAEAHGKYYDEFALSQEFLFERDMEALHVHRPTMVPRARSYVPHVLQLAAALLVAGRAYEREGYVFFRGARVHERAGLDRATALELAAAFGDEPDDPMRDDPLDVPVWRPSSERDPAWPSPWGWGRPGWHAECAAMAAATLGSSVDVLVGGEDLTFPHHAHQAAMVEAAVSVGPFARRMLHVGAVHQDGAKMSKSIGNLTLVADLLETAPPAAIRLMLLDRPWHKHWEYRPELLAAATDRLHDLYSAASRPGSTEAAEKEVAAALLDDLDVSRALSVATEAGGSAGRLLIRVLSLG